MPDKDVFIHDLYTRLKTKQRYILTNIHIKKPYYYYYYINY